VLDIKKRAKSAQKRAKGSESLRAKARKARKIEIEKRAESAQSAHFACARVVTRKSYVKRRRAPAPCGGAPRQSLWR
jgi:hypothetical protein